MYISVFDHLVSWTYVYCHKKKPNRHPAPRRFHLQANIAPALLDSLDLGHDNVMPWFKGATKNVPKNVSDA
jgi:hypothetical protein